MKPIALALALISSLTASVSLGSDALETTGFQMEQDGLYATTWNFRDQVTLIISKRGFKTEKAAKEFCKSYNSELDTEFSALTIAMSGAALHSKVLEKAISWKIMDRSGIWQWVGKDQKILVLTDGQGLQEELISERHLSKVAIEGVPAICVSPAASGT